MEELPQTGDRYFDAVLKVITDNIGKMVNDENERRFYESLVVGGKEAATHVVVYCEEMKNLYGEGDADKALGLTKLFTLLMLAQSFRWLSENHPDSAGDTTESSKTAASNILAFFGDKDENTIKLFTSLKNQFDYDSKNMPSMVHMGGFVLGWAAEAMGHRCLEWEKVNFPVESMTEVTQSGVLIDSTPMRSPGDIKALWACHGTGCKALMEHYEGKKIDAETTADNPESD